MKISKRVVLIMGCIFTVVGLGLIVTASESTKTLFMNFDNAIQHIDKIKLISDTENNTTVAIMEKVGSGITKIETSNFILTKDDNKEIPNNSKSTILGGEGNEIKGGKYIVILGGLRNSINGSYSSILGGEGGNIEGGQGNSILGGKDNLIRGNNYSVIVGGSGNKINDSYSAVIGVDSSVEGDHSIALGKNSKLKADNSFLWTDGNYADETLQTDNVFVVMSMSGMVINTGSAHKFAKLTIGGPIIMYADKNDENAECGGGIGGGTLKVVNNKSNTGQVCLCSCDGSGRNSVFGKGKCQSTCNVTIEPKCGTDVQKICSDGKYMYSGSCEKGEVIEGTGAYMVSKDDKIHWSCQSTDGAVVGCSGTVLATPVKCEKIECAGTKPSGDGVEIVNSGVDVNGTSKWTYVPNYVGHVISCQWTCKRGYIQSGNTNTCCQSSITYDCNRGSGSTWSQQIITGDEIYPSTGCTLNNADLLGWSSDSGATVPDPGQSTGYRIRNYQCGSQILYAIYDKCPEGKEKKNGRCVNITQCDSGMARNEMGICEVIGQCENEFGLTKDVNVDMTGFSFTASGIDWYKPLGSSTGRWTCVDNTQSLTAHSCTFSCDEDYECGIQGSGQQDTAYNKHATCMPKVRCEGDYTSNDSSVGHYRESKYVHDTARDGRVYKNPTPGNTGWTFVNTTGEIDTTKEGCFIVCDPGFHIDETRLDGICVSNCEGGTSQGNRAMIQMSSLGGWDSSPYRRKWKYLDPNEYNNKESEAGENFGSGKENSCLWTCTGGAVPIGISGKKESRYAYAIYGDGTTGEIQEFSGYLRAISGQFYNLNYNICRHECGYNQIFQLYQCRNVTKGYMPDSGSQVIYSGISNPMLQIKMCGGGLVFNSITDKCQNDSISDKDACEKQNSSVPDGGKRYLRDKDTCSSCTIGRKLEKKDDKRECVVCTPEQIEKDPDCVKDSN